MDCSINGILPESPNGITAPSTIHASSVRLGAKPEQFEPAASYCQAVPFGWIGRALPPPENASGSLRFFNRPRNKMERHIPAG